MLNRLRLFTRHKYFLIRLIAYSLLICLVPIGVLGFFFYHSVQASMHSDIEQANNRYLDQTVNAMELVIKQVGSGYRQFVTNSTLLEFDRLPYGNYFDEIDHWYLSDHQKELTEYIQLKAKVQQNIETLMQHSDFIYSIYYIHPERGIVLTNGPLQYEIERFYDKGWQDGLAPGTLGYPLIMNVRQAVQADGSLKSVVPVFFRPMQVNYTVVINLDADIFYRNFISSLDTKGHTSLIVFSDSKEPLFYDRAVYRTEDVERIQKEVANPESDGQAAAVQKNSKVLAEQQLITWQHSKVLGWTIVEVTNLQDLYVSVSRIRTLFLTVSVMLAIATVVLTIITSRRMYRPVQHILQFIKEGYRDDSSAERGARKQKGEFRVIRDSLADVHAAGIRLQSKLRESMPAYQEKFVRSLLQAHHFTDDEIRERLDFLGIPLRPEGIALLLVSVRPDRRKAQSAEKEAIEHLLVTEDLVEALADRNDYWVQELEEELYLVLINCEEQETATIFGLAERIKRAVESRRSADCAVGLAMYCRSIGELARGYQEASEALQYRGMASDTDVIYIGDVRLHPRAQLPYPKKKEDALLLSIKNGDREQALLVFAELVNDMRAAVGTGGLPHIQQTFYLLVVKLFEAAHEMKPDIRTAMPEMRLDLLVSAIQRGDWQETTGRIEQWIGEASLCIFNAFHIKKNMHVEQAKDILEYGDAKAISLTYVAERLGLNPSYLSRIFKEYTGFTFTDYLARLRIDKSKHLLLESDLRVKEISERLGYAKSNHFIKLFKDMTGQTPGDFREKHR